jgi:hypothetical protein
MYNTTSNMFKLFIIKTITHMYNTAICYMGDCLYYKQFKHITGCIVHMGDCLYYKQFKHITGCIK